MQSESELIVAAFCQHCGEERFNRFVRDLEGYGRHRARLRHWQEKLWGEFAASFPHEQPINPVETASLFGLTIPAKVLHWVQLKAGQVYLLDLVQLPDGARYVRPRESGDPRTPHTVVSTLPASASTLRDAATNGQGPKLENGETFVIDPHGVWLTEAEYRLIASNLRRPEESAPWVNGMPPQIPPK